MAWGSIHTDKTLCQFHAKKQGKLRYESLLITATVSLSDFESEFLTYLVGHVIVGGPVEVVVRPAGKLILVVLLGAPVVVEGELRVGLQELRLLHLSYCSLTNN